MTHKDDLLRLRSIEVNALRSEIDRLNNKIDLLSKHIEFLEAQIEIAKQVTFNN